MNANIADQHTARSALDRQLEGVGWALFLIMIGGIGLMQNVPQGTWLVGTGLIMAHGSTAAARYRPFMLLA